MIYSEIFTLLFIEYIVTNIKREGEEKTWSGIKPLNSIAMLAGVSKRPNYILFLPLCPAFLSPFKSPEKSLNVLFFLQSRILEKYVAKLH